METTIRNAYRYCFEYDKEYDKYFDNYLNNGFDYKNIELQWKSDKNDYDKLTEFMSESAIYQAFQYLEYN